MVTVPIYERDQTLRPNYRQGIDVQASADDFGAAIGRGMQNMAQGGMQLAESVRQVEDLKATLEAKDNLTAFQREKMELDYGPDGYLTTQGRNAVDRRAQYNQALEELKKKHAPKSSLASTKYNDAATAAVTDGMRTGIVHAAQGQKDWAASSSTARLELLRDQALAGYDNPNEIKKSLALGFGEIDSQASLMGWGSDVVELKRKEFSTQVHSNVAIAIASKPGGARAAMTYIKDNGGSIDAKTKLDLETKLRPFAVEEEALSVVNEVVTGKRGQKVSELPGDIVAEVAGLSPESGGGGGPTRAKAYLASKSDHVGRPGDTMNLDDAFADNLAAMIQDAPEYIRNGLSLGSAYRSNERQKDLFEASDKTGRNVAFPAGYVKPDGSIAKGSNHLHGRAVDLNYNGRRLDQAPKEVRDWIHGNAANYGLRFPMSWEPWHIEPNGGGAPVGSTATPARDGVAARSIMPSYGEAMDRINQITDPEVRASAIKQLNAQFELRSKAEAANADQAKTQIFTMMMQGTPLSAIPLDMKIAAGREAVSGFMDFENKGKVNTDPVAYSKLTTLAAAYPSEFAKLDLTAPEIINSLSREDWKSISDKKSSILGNERKAREEGANVVAAMSQAQTQLEAVGITTANKEGAEREASAKRIADFQNSLTSEMEAFKRMNNERPPTQMEVQQIINKLLLPIVIKEQRSSMNPASWFGSATSDTTGKMLFEAGWRPDGSTVDVVVEYSDIPIDLRRGIAADFERKNGRKPTEAEVINEYEAFILNR